MLFEFHYKYHLCDFFKNNRKLFFKSRFINKFAKKLKTIHNNLLAKFISYSKITKKIYNSYIYLINNVFNKKVCLNIKYIKIK